MKQSIVLSALGLAALGVQAQEVGRVISSTPVVQQVAVPRQVCTNQQVAVQHPTTGAGSVMGAIAGGAVGNAIGDGSGRAVATAIGLLGGAILGNRIEGQGPTEVQNHQQCTTQTFYENRAVSYNVVYEFAGKQYSVQMPQDPGPTVQLQVTPVQPAAPAYAPQPQAPQVMLAPPVQTVVTVPQTVVVPHYYYRPYYPPVSLHLGYHRGWGHHHRHWR
jgi:uncharacterized protein YcfJ